MGHFCPIFTSNPKKFSKNSPFLADLGLVWCKKFFCTKRTSPFGTKINLKLSRSQKRAPGGIFRPYLGPIFRGSLFISREEVRRSYERALYWNRLIGPRASSNKFFAVFFEPNYPILVMELSVHRQSLHKIFKKIFSPISGSKPPLWPLGTP